MNTTALAFIGDAVYEVYIREYVLEDEIHADMLHRKAVKYVRAEAQAMVSREMLKEGFFTEEEEKLFKRARNHKSSQKSRSASAVDYKLATAFEAVLGELKTSGQIDRLEEIIGRAIDIVDREAPGKAKGAGSAGEAENE